MNASETNLLPTAHPHVFVERVLYRTAYARNGNAHNPTKYYRWNAYLVIDGGKRITISSYFRTKREAIAEGIAAARTTFGA